MSSEPPKITLESDLLQAVKSGLHEAIKSKLTAYNSPLDKVLDAVLQGHGSSIRSLLSEAVHSAVGDEGFREQIKGAVRARLAKQLVEKFGGEMEKQINLLKSDPATRARITVAMDEIVKSLVK